MVVPARSAGGTDQAIVQLVLDRYLQVSEAIEVVAEKEPSALASPGAVEELAASLSGDDIVSERISVLRTQSSEFSRYYYAHAGVLEPHGRAGRPFARHLQAGGWVP